MTQNKVCTVFNSYDMQKYFLILTKKAEEFVYENLPEATKMKFTIEDFLEKVRKTPALKKVIQDMILLSVSEIDWEFTFDLLEDFYVENSQRTSF